jgi:hypothetical protein
MGKGWGDVIKPNFLPPAGRTEVLCLAIDKPGAMFWLSMEREAQGRAGGFSRNWRVSAL